ncbi:hypothetical protein [Luteolibacter marinus]|uniref:hypothetical protein n=1 Tax=Luteolibacter marinus TaxID=2776705 RepID=UPI001869364B|nr:hypothetical protein [Luteolibacter marinus]
MENETSFSLVRDDAWFRLQRALRLIPADGGDGVVRRAVLYVLLAWLPLVVWAMATGHAFTSSSGEPLLRHYGIHARFLIALPVLIFGERLARAVMRTLLPRFVSTGVVPAAKQDAWRQAINATAKLRNSTLPWAGIAGIILVVILLPSTGPQAAELDWAREQGQLGFGGWWYLLVSRPLFQLFLFGWLWRVVLLGVLMKRIAGLGLDLVPAHPDQLGAIGFVRLFPLVFVPLAFATSSILSAHWAHEIAWHGAHVASFKMQAGAFLGVILLLCLAPLAMFNKVLKRSRYQALVEYDHLIARHGRMVHQKWIEGRDPEDDGLLDAPELGPTADINGLYDAIVSMKKHPFSKTSLAIIALPAVIPMILVASMDVPLLEVLGKVFKTLL